MGRHPIAHSVNSRQYGGGAVWLCSWWRRFSSHFITILILYSLAWTDTLPNATLASVAYGKKSGHADYLSPVNYRSGSIKPSYN